MRKAARKILMQRALMRYMARRIHGKAAPKSIPMKSSAQGFTAVPQSLSLENKVDSILARLGDEKSQARCGEAAAGGDALLSKKVDALHSKIELLFHQVQQLTAKMDRVYPEGGDA